MSSKKAQVGETMTWVVATIIIVIILIVSIFVSTAYLGGGKNVNFFKRTDVLASKSLFSYLLTKDSEGNQVYNQLKNEENLNEFNGNLGMEIFKEFYGEEYEDVWLGIILNRTFIPAKSNNYFGNKPTGVRAVGETSASSRFVSSISEKIKLNENKSLELVLAEEGSVR